MTLANPPSSRPPDAASPSVGFRRRGEALRAAIFEATLEQLRTVGYARLTMEGVAAAAGTGKAALYRRWSGKQELVADALRNALPDPRQVSLAGDPRADLLALLRCMRDAMDVTYGNVFQVVKDETGAGSGLLAELFKGRVLLPCQEMIQDVLARGASSGQFRADLAVEVIGRVGPAMLIYHAMAETPETPDAFLASVVDDVILPMVAAAGRPGA